MTSVNRTIFLLSRLTRPLIDLALFRLLLPPLSSRSSSLPLYLNSFLFFSLPFSSRLFSSLLLSYLISSTFPSIILIPSILYLLHLSALVPRAELEGDMTDQQMGLQARLMSKALRKITGWEIIKQTNKQRSK